METPSSVGFRIGKVAKTTLFFSFFGPVIGMVVFGVGYFFLESGLFAAIASLVLFFLPPFLGIGLPVAFYVGFLPSVASGFFVGGYTALVVNPKWEVVFGIGFLIGVLQIILFGVGDMPPPRYTVVSKLEPLLALQILTVATCAVTTMLCWGGVRLWNQERLKS